MDMTELRGVIFDWDGTLVDSAALIMRAFHEATNEVLGERFPATRRDELMVFTMPAIDSFGMLSDDPLVVDALLERYDAAYTRLSDALLRPQGGTHDALLELRARGLRIGVVTSKVRRRVDADARRCGLTGLVDAFVTSDSGTVAKPHPAPIWECLRLLDVAGSETLFAGDGPHDMIAARAAGLVTAAVISGTYSREELTQDHPDFVVNDPAELVDIVDLLAARWAVPAAPHQEAGGGAHGPGASGGI